MSRTPLRRRIMNHLLSIAAGLLTVAALVRLFENRFIFFPPRYPEGFVSPEVYGLHLEEVWITASDGVRLNAWFLPSLSSPRVLVWFHGNAENIGYGLGQLKVFSRLGVNLLALDYRGYGKSEGSPSEEGVYRDAEAAYRYLLDQRRFAPREIVLYGHSLGGAVAVDLASRHECGGLIVESSFTCAREVARRSFRIPLFEYVPKSRFDSLAKMARVRAPVLIVHGTKDPFFPVSMAERLFQAAPGPKWLFIIDGAVHDDPYLVGGEKYLDRLRSFCQGVSLAPRTGTSLETRPPA